MGSVQGVQWSAASAEDTGTTSAASAEDNDVPLGKKADTGRSGRKVSRGRGMLTEDVEPNRKEGDVAR